jgi:hypothetical protein
MIYLAAATSCREHRLSEKAMMRLALALGGVLKSMGGPSRGTYRGSEREDERVCPLFGSRFHCGL